MNIMLKEIETVSIYQENNRKYNLVSIVLPREVNYVYKEIMLGCFLTNSVLSD